MTTTEIDALNAEILAETQKLVETYASSFSGDLEGELRAWLHIAARREAMVCEVYEEANRAYQLPGSPVPAREVAWEAFTLIWQQEEVHTTFIEVTLKDGLFRERSLNAERMAWLGRIEGKFLAALTGRPGLRQVLSRLAVRFGTMAAPGQLPEFTSALTALDPREFFLLCATLETTAHQCYARMAACANELVDVLAARRAPRRIQLESLSRQLRSTTLEEKFHHDAFQEVAGWFVDGRLDPSLTAHGCAERVARLLPRGARAVGDPDSPYVIIDGGLGPLFKRCGVSIVLDETVERPGRPGVSNSQ